MSGISSYQIIKLNAQNESDIVNNFTQLLQNEQTCPDGCLSVSRLLYEHSHYRKIINEVKNNLSYKLEQKILKTNFYKQKCFLPKLQCFPKIYRVESKSFAKQRTFFAPCFCSRRTSNYAEHFASFL